MVGHGPAVEAPHGAAIGAPRAAETAPRALEARCTLQVEMDTAVGKIPASPSSTASGEQARRASSVFGKSISEVRAAQFFSTVACGSVSTDASRTAANHIPAQAKTVEQQAGVQRSTAGRAAPPPAAGSERNRRTGHHTAHKTGSSLSPSPPTPRSDSAPCGAAELAAAPTQLKWADPRRPRTVQRSPTRWHRLSPWSMTEDNKSICLGSFDFDAARVLAAHVAHASERA